MKVENIFPKIIQLYVPFFLDHFFQVRGTFTVFNSLVLFFFLIIANTHHFLQFFQKEVWINYW